MMRKLRSWRDERGAAALEFALVLPILVALLLLGVQGWLQINQVSQMRSGLQAGARYYQTGGTDDATAASLALQSWVNHPNSSTVNASRSCSCGGAGASCSSQCADSSLPNVYVTLTANASYSNLMGVQPLSQSSAVRLR